jgi:hypothetical protein
MLKEIRESSTENSINSNHGIGSPGEIRTLAYAETILKEMSIGLEPVWV